MLLCGCVFFFLCLLFFLKLVCIYVVFDNKELILIENSLINIGNCYFLNISFFENI